MRAPLVVTQPFDLNMTWMTENPRRQRETGGHRGQTETVWTWTWSGPRRHSEFMVGRKLRLDTGNQGVLVKRARRDWMT